MPNHFDLKTCIPCNKKPIHHNHTHGPKITTLKPHGHLHAFSDIFPDPNPTPTIQQMYHNYLLHKSSKNTHSMPIKKRLYYDPFISTHPNFLKTKYNTEFFIIDHRHKFDRNYYDNHRNKLHDMFPCPKRCIYHNKYYCPHHRPRCTKACSYKNHDWCPYHSIGCPRNCAHYHKECCPYHRPHCPVNCSYVNKHFCPQHRPGCPEKCKHYHETYCPIHRPGCPHGCKFHDHLFCRLHRPRCPSKCVYSNSSYCPHHGYFNPYKPPQSIHINEWHDMLVFYGYHYDVHTHFHHLGKITRRNLPSKDLNFSGNYTEGEKCPTCPPNAYVTNKDGSTTTVSKWLNQKKFGESTNRKCPCPKGPVYNGLLNVKKSKMSASANTDHKKNTQLFNDEFQNFNCEKQDICKNPNSRHSNVGGPGKLYESQPRFKTRVVTGYKARLISPLKKGVDKKHGSYNRYLMKKKALYQQKELCIRCK